MRGGREALRTPHPRLTSLYVFFLASTVSASTLEQLVRDEEQAEARDLVDNLLDRDDRAHGINVRDHNGATALMHAAGIGSLAAIRLIIGKGADVRLADDYGMTALHRAAEGGMHEACTLLLAHGAVRDAKDALNLRPADVAHAWGHPALAEQLGHSTPWSGTKTSSERLPPFNADGTEEPANPRWMREL